MTYCATEGQDSLIDDPGLRDAREAAEARIVAVAAADPDWRANHLTAVRLTLALEEEVTARWPARVRCLHVHTELGRVAMFFAGHHSLRDEVLRRVAEHPGLRGFFISVGDDGRRMRVGVAPSPPAAQDPLSASELHFINFLVEQALRAWTHEI